MALKTLIDNVTVDRALKSHNCQANKRHRIHQGDVRLNVAEGRGWKRYCVACAIQIIDRDIAKLEALKELNPEA